MEENITLRTRFQHRRAAAARWAQVNPVLGEGELGLELDTYRFKFGDGLSAWNDLPYAGHELQPATASHLGGIVAADKTSDYDVEVKKDPATHKLYVPPAGREDGTLPAVTIRITYKQQPQSEHFPNEPGPIQNADIYFRPLCDPEYFNTIAPGLYIALARCTSRHRQHQTKVAGRSNRSIGWHVIGAQSVNLPPQDTYPNKNTFEANFYNGPCWTYADTPPIPISQIVGKYEGQWIKLPYDLETVVRRFIYIYQKVSDTSVTVLPIQTLHSREAVTNGYLKISSLQNRMDLSNVRTKDSDFYASVNLGFCLCRYIEKPANYHRYIFGPVAHKRAMVTSSKYNDYILYLLKDSFRKKHR